MFAWPPGGPGIEPKWTRGNKVAAGTAFSTSSRVWYTMDHGSVTEVYYPTIDSPQICDLQFMVTDGETFFHDERRHFVDEITCASKAAPDSTSSIGRRTAATASVRQSWATLIKTVF